MLISAIWQKICKTYAPEVYVQTHIHICENKSTTIMMVLAINSGTTDNTLLPNFNFPPISHSKWPLQLVKIDNLFTLCYRSPVSYNGSDLNYSFVLYKVLIKPWFSRTYFSKSANLYVLPVFTVSDKCYWPLPEIRFYNYDLGTYHIISLSKCCWKFQELFEMLLQAWTKHYLITVNTEFRFPWMNLMGNIKGHLWFGILTVLIWPRNDYGSITGPECREKRDGSQQGTQTWHSLDHFSTFQ